MNRLASFLVFFTVVIGLLAGIHYYLWARLIRDLELPATLELTASIALVGLGVSIPLGLILGRVLPRKLVGPWLALTYAWMGTMWLLLVVVLGVDVLKLAIAVVRSFGEPALENLGQVLAGNGEGQHSEARLYGAGAVALGGAATLVAFWEGLRVRVKRVEVPLAKLSEALDGITIVQLSDVHVGPTIGRRFIERVVASVNALKPDVVVITGDLVDGSVTQLADAVSPLQRIDARHGIYFVTGNHEYYSGAPEWCEHLTQLGVRVLRNERVVIATNAGSFELAGIDDYQGRSIGQGHGADLVRAVAGRDPERVLVLLAHQPRAITEAARHGVDLQLSGHTHGGQIWPFNFLVKLQQPFVSGLERVGQTLLYVSNGTGYWGPPMRLRAPAEITHLTLRAAPRDV